MKRLSILGSTGSIGTQTLDVIKQHSGKFEVQALSAGRNLDLIVKQVQEFKPKLVSIVSQDNAEKLKEMISGKTEVTFGEKGLNEVATFNDSDTIVTAIVGHVGLKPTMNAINAGKNIALANKETLVCAGEIVMKAVKEKGINLMPVDSEHSALFQCLNGERRQDVNKMIITCSGGSFRGKKKAELENVTVEQALNHPNWSMGGKITIDSASLMNKGLEVIEAKWLYDLEVEQIQAVVHPQSIIHSMVEFKDGSVMAQLGQHDMRIMIQYALSFPERLPINIPKLDFVKLKELTFFEPDLETFPCLKYAFDSLKVGGSMPAAINAANEIAVKHFLQGKIKFMQIPETVKQVMDTHTVVKNPSLEDILEVNERVSKETEKFLVGE
ncbi:MAG: 1-deoxy-D-xylulose-5-phosphate reductoisomerase [archaeon]